MNQSGYLPENNEDVYKTTSWRYSYIGGHGIKVRNGRNTGGKKVLVLGDSYERTTIPFLAPGLSEVQCLHMRGYRGNLKEYIEKQEIDAVVVAYTSFLIGAHDDQTSFNYAMFDFFLKKAENMAAGLQLLFKTWEAAHRGGLLTEQEKKKYKKYESEEKGKGEMVYFNIPPFTGKETEYMKEAVSLRKISGDGKFTKKCSEWLKQNTGTKKALLTTSCTHALEMAALLADIQPGDEVIMPSYTFVSTADAFVLRGAKIVFVDIRPDTMNINEEMVGGAVTEKTKAIVPVHYAGVSCEMDTIMDIAKQHHLMVIEDAAQGIMSTYKGRALGTIGDYGCYSFHETKNYSMGEGGALLIRDDAHIELAEIIREKGTNRSKFFRGEVDKYTWVNPGSSYLPSELNAAYLWAQLENAEEILNDRMKSWNLYYQELKDLEPVELPVIPEGCVHNAHMFYIKVKDLETRTELIDFLRKNDIYSVFHYVPLHSSTAGKKHGMFYGEDRYTTKESNRLLRLPMYFGLKNSDILYIVEKIKEFYK